MRLTREESRWLLRTLRARDEKLIAQVHSHPGSAFHSPGDNERAASFHPGYFSIVVPGFARNIEAIEDCALFEFDGREFRSISSDSAARRVQFTSLVAVRTPEPLKSQPTSQGDEPGWLRTIVSKLKQKLTGRRRQ